MNKLRVSNIQSYTSLPYRLLSTLKFVDYREGFPAENARMLNEGEVDVALIPVSEFAIHGGYVGLDFGIAGCSKIDAVCLFSEEPMQRLQTIYLDVNSNSSVHLLRLLLLEKWGRIPKFVRVERELLLDNIGPDVGALVTGDMALNVRREYPYELDLAKEWNSLTGLPFVFCVWAARPEVLSRDADKELNSLFYRAIKARESLAVESSNEVRLPLEESSKHISNTVIYHLDADCQRGMSEFFKRAFKYNLIPDEPYRTARYTMIGGISSTAKKPKSIPEILQDSTNGRRMSVADGIKLANDASLADLALAADLIRTRSFDSRTLNFTLGITTVEIEEIEPLRDILSLLEEEAQSPLTLKISDAELTDLSFYENLIDRLRREFAVGIEAFTIPQVLSYAQQNNLSIREIASRLVTAGIDFIPADGGELLLDRYLDGIKKSSYKAADWISAMKWFHRFGAKSCATLNISEFNTWEERFLHLQKIRSLQDETPGFRYFYMQVASTNERDSLLRSETPLRANMISRLFLDNITHLQERSITTQPVIGMLNLSFGSSSVKIDLSSKNQELAKQTLGFLSSLKEFGMDFEKVERPIAQKPVLN